MYSELPENIRDQHPYYMYDEIRAQPDAVARSLELVAAQGGAVCAAVAGARRVFLTGCGTSFHAALAGATMLRALSDGALDARAVQAYELVNFSPGLRPDDAVIGFTHSGTSRMTIEALRAAREVGAETIALTGFPQSPVAEAAGHVLPTGYNQEWSWAHTVSYTAALASVAGIANALAGEGQRLDLSSLPDAMNEALQVEGAAHRLAAGSVGLTTPIVLAGGGPNEATAYEGALKLLETSYLPAAGWELEQILHGPLAAVPAGSLVFIIAPAGASTDRAVQLMHALAEMDVTPVVQCTADNADRFDDAHRFLLPEIPEALSPIVQVAPLQFFSYFLAVGNGFNPDLIHRDVDQYRLAAARYD